MKEIYADFNNFADDRTLDLGCLGSVQSIAAFGEVVRYPDLAGAITEAWKARGAHRDEGDKALDQLGIHVDDRAPFQLLVAMLDAANAPKRDLALAGQRVRVPVFNVTLYVR